MTNTKTFLRKGFNERRLASPLDGQTEPVVLKAMDEYAKEVSIGFAEWMRDNYYMDNEGFFMHDYQHKVHYPIPDLFSLYMDFRLLTLLME